MALATAIWKSPRACSQRGSRAEGARPAQSAPGKAPLLPRRCVAPCLRRRAPGPARTVTKLRHRRVTPLYSRSASTFRPCTTSSVCGQVAGRCVEQGARRPRARHSDATSAAGAHIAAALWSCPRAHLEPAPAADDGAVLLAAGRHVSSHVALRLKHARQLVLQGLALLGDAGCVPEVAPVVAVQKLQLIISQLNPCLHTRAGGRAPRHA